MRTVNATEARAHIFQMIDEVDATRTPIQIKGKRSSAILISEADWRAIQETLYLSSIPGMVASILEGGSEPIGACAKDLPW
jgi:prevent-host-death family protein